MSSKKNEHVQEGGKIHWWYVATAIAGIDAQPAQKYLLTLILRHTHVRKGYAWTSQKTLAWEMGVDVSTVKRIFQWGKRLGIIAVRPVRHGQGKTDQHNEYWLNLPRLIELERPPDHPAPVMGDNKDKHSAPISPAQTEHGAPMPPAQNGAGLKSQSSTAQIAPEQGANDVRAGRTHEPVGFDLQQVVSNAGEYKAGFERAPVFDVSLD